MYRRLPRQSQITIDESGANTAAIDSVDDEACLDIELRQPKYLTNVVEHDRRAVKRSVDPMIWLKVVLECPETDC